MPPADEDTERLEEIREGRLAKAKVIAREVAAEDRALMWDRLGFDVRTEAGIARLRFTLLAWERLGLDVVSDDRHARTRKMIEWAFRAYEQAETRNKRLLGWLAAAVSVAGGLLGIINYWITWRRP